MIPRARVVPILIAAAVVAACSDTTNPEVTQLNLDRPVDMAFACYGGLRITNGADAKPTDPIVVSAQPFESCNFRSGPPVDDKAPVPFGQGEVGGLQPSGVFWYGLILESGPGTVAVARFQTSPVNQFASDASVRDANKLTPGTNGISVGEDPVAIATDKLGCHAITANAGSCDLSALDLTSALDEVQPVYKVDRIPVKSSLGEVIRARPSAMVAEPPAGQLGVSCPAQPGGIVYVAYPNCHLVAAVNAGTGTIVSGIKYDELGVPSLVGGDVSCPAECGGGGVFTAGPRPVTLDLEFDERTQTRRLVIGSDNSSSFSLVELDVDSLPLSISQVALENTTGNLGITQIALSPTIGIGGAGSTDVFDDGASGGDFQFVYAIATDHTVRVADVLTLRKECDTQVDPRFLRGIQNVRQLGCLVVGDPTTPPRRATASGPGIQVGIPLSLEIVRSQKVQSVATNPDNLIGYFAVVTTAGGGAFVINVDDDVYSDTFQSSSPLAVTVQDAIAHQLRDAVPARETLSTTQVEDPNHPDAKVTVPLCKYNGPVTDDGSAVAGPRASGIPARNTPVGNVDPNKVTELPYFRQLKCVSEAEGLFSDTDAAGIAITELSFSAPADVRDRTFPDLHSLARDEAWTLTWEGSLSQDQSDDNIDGPGVRESQLVVD
ncbi:MAG TPA: hypothetical protein VGO64_10255, partial [Candidatus Limnocylindrales bacterium]|nr:hypothetical protein [Candidatus Limnocylindrales bacterium]